MTDNYWGQLKDISGHIQVNTQTYQISVNGYIALTQDWSNAATAFDYLEFKAEVQDPAPPLRKLMFLLSDNNQWAITFFDTDGRQNTPRATFNDQNFQLTQTPDRVSLLVSIQIDINDNTSILQQIIVLTNIDLSLTKFLRVKQLFHSYVDLASSLLDSATSTVLNVWQQNEAMYLEPAATNAALCYTVKVFFDDKTGQAANAAGTRNAGSIWDQLITAQISGATHVWGRYPNGAIFERSDVATEAYIVELTDSKSSDQPPGSEKIVLNVGNAKLNRFLLAHEAGHLFGLDHPDGESSNTNSRWLGSIMQPRTPNLPLLLSSELVQVRAFLVTADERKVIRPTGTSNAINALNTNNLSDVQMPLGKVPIMFIRGFHYDNGYSLDKNLLDLAPASIPDRTQLDFNCTSDLSWWGWHSDLCNVWQQPASVENEPDRCQSELGFFSGYQHQDPKPGQKNYLYVRVTICDGFDAEGIKEPVWLAFFQADFQGDSVKVSQLQGISSDSSGWVNMGQGVSGTLKKYVEWMPTRDWASLQNDRWLLAVAWNYRMPFPTIPGVFTPLWLLPISLSYDFLVKSFDVFTKAFLLSQLNRTIGRDKFKQWLAENRCIAVRRPGDPCA